MPSVKADLSEFGDELKDELLDMLRNQGVSRSLCAMTRALLVIRRECRAEVDGSSAKLLRSVSSRLRRQAEQLSKENL